MTNRCEHKTEQRLRLADEQNLIFPVSRDVVSVSISLRSRYHMLQHLSLSFMELRGTSRLKQKTKCLHFSIVTKGLETKFVQNAFWFEQLDAVHR